MEVFSRVGRRDFAARLALTSDALKGDQALFPLVAGATVEELFPQSPLRQAMELFLGKPGGRITLADLQTVTYLSIGGEDRLTGGRTVAVGADPDGDPAAAVSLQVEAGSAGDGLGILFFQGLRGLEIRSTAAKQAELMLPQLTALAIYGVQMEDLTPLAHLPALEKLTLSAAGIPSLEGLEALPALRSLSLRDSKLTDLSLLPAQKGITELALLDNDDLSGVSSLAQMTQLTGLSLSGDALSDLSPIASLTGLKRLSITDTSIRNTDFLSGMIGLEELVFTDNDKVEAIPQLASLPALTSLTLESDELFGGKDTLNSLTNLRALTLRSTKELSYLLPLKNLEELTLYFYRYDVDLSALSGFQHLRVLRFPGETMGSGYTAQFSGLRALKSLPLEELYIIGHKLYEPLDPVLSIPTLRALDLTGVNAEVTNFSLFGHLSQLQKLSLRDFDDMRDIPPGPDEQYWSYEAGPASAFVDQLGGLTGLTWLDLSECGAGDISALAGLTNLTWLDLSGNDISDISVLKNLDALTYLNLSGNPIGDLSAVESREGLSFLDANAHITRISQTIAQRLEKFFAQYGIRLVNFCINSINVPEGDPSVQKLKEVLSKRQEMDALNFDYKQAKTFDVLSLAAENLGGDGGMSGIGVGAVMGSAMSDLVRNTLKTEPAPQAPAFCRHCGGALPAGSAFCPKCGQAVSASESARCGHCGTPCQPGDRFCTRCGQPLDSEPTPAT